MEISCAFGARRAKVLGTVVAGLLIAGSTLASGTHPTFDHFESGADTQIPTEAENDDTIVFAVEQTCAKSFAYSFRGLRVQEEEEAAALRSITKKYDCLAMDERELLIHHESKYGGYLIEIESLSQAPVRAFLPNSDTITRLKDPTTAAATLSDLEDDSIEDLKKKGTLKDLPAKTVVVLSVSGREVDFSFAGGFSISELTDPSFAVVKREVEGGEHNFVVRDSEAEDDFKLGLTAMIHAHHARWWPWIAASFGLGVGSSSDVNYFLGPSIRLGGKGFLTLGYQFGPRERLPSGVHESDLDNLKIEDAVSDVNVLNSLPSKTDGAFFVSVSYTFLGSGLDALKKPFAPATATGAK